MILREIFPIGFSSSATEDMYFISSRLTCCLEQKMASDESFYYGKHRGRSSKQGKKTAGIRNGG